MGSGKAAGRCHIGSISDKEVGVTADMAVTPYTSEGVRSESVFAKLRGRVDDLLDVLKEPRIDQGQLGVMSDGCDPRSGTALLIRRQRVAKWTRRGPGAHARAASR